MKTLISDKTRLRAQLSQRRQTYVGGLDHAQIQDASRKVLRRLRQLVDMSKIGVVGSYLTYGHEFDTALINQQLIEEGVPLALPAVNPDHSMVFRRVENLHQVEAGAFGVGQPTKEALQVKPDLILVPLLGFDSDCNRIGYGKGHFDRYVQQARTSRNILAIGVAYDIQKVDKIPAEPTDQTLDGVMTEKETYT